MLPARVEGSWHSATGLNQPLAMMQEIFKDETSPGLRLMKPNAPVRQRSASREVTVPERANRIRLLLAEDDGGIRFALREFLSTAGYDVSEAESCDGALRAVRESQPDLLLLDFALPDGDALSLLPRLRELAPDLGIVLLTGFGTVDLAVRAIKSGADHFLCKPVQLPELDSILRGLARQRHLERARRTDRGIRSSGPDHRPDRRGQGRARLVAACAWTARR